MPDDEVTLSVEGLPELYAQFNELIKSMEPEKVEPILMDGAKSFQTALQAVAPEVTGTFKKSIKARYMQTRWPGVPRSVIVSSKDPVLHLLEFGHVNWRGGIRKKGEGHAISGFTPAHPFFRPVVDSNREGVMNQVVDDLKSAIDQAVT